MIVREVQQSHSCTFCGTMDPLSHWKATMAPKNERLCHIGVQTKHLIYRIAYLFSFCNEGQSSVSLSTGPLHVCIVYLLCLSGLCRRMSGMQVARIVCNNVASIVCMCVCVYVNQSHIVFVFMMFREVHQWIRSIFCGTMDPLSHSKATMAPKNERLCHIGVD